MYPLPAAPDILTRTRRGAENNIAMAPAIYYFEINAAVARTARSLRKRDHHYRTRVLKVLRVYGSMYCRYGQSPDYLSGNRRRFMESDIVTVV